MHSLFFLQKTTFLLFKITISSTNHVVLGMWTPKYYKWEIKLIQTFWSILESFKNNFQQYFKGNNLKYAPRYVY